MNRKKIAVLREASIRSVRPMLSGVSKPGSALTTKELDVLWEMAESYSLTIWTDGGTTIGRTLQKNSNKNVLRIEITDLWNPYVEHTQIERGRVYQESDIHFKTAGYNAAYRCFLKEVSLYKDNSDKETEA